MTSCKYCLDLERLQKSILVDMKHIQDLNSNEMIDCLAGVASS